MDFADGSFTEPSKSFFVLFSASFERVRHHVFSPCYMILPHFLPPHVSVLFSHAQRAFGRNLQITTKLFYEKLKQKSMTLLKKKFFRSVMDKNNTI